LRRKSAELRKEPLPLCRLLFSRSKPFLAAADHPKLGLRELIVPFGRSAYLVRYFHNQLRDTVIVIRVWHASEAR
jgi:plasmid stabilization system protein ParE